MIKPKLISRDDGGGGEQEETRAPNGFSRALELRQTNTGEMSDSVTEKNLSSLGSLIIHTSVFLTFRGEEQDTRRPPSRSNTTMSTKENAPTKTPNHAATQRKGEINEQS